MPKGIMGSRPGSNIATAVRPTTYQPVGIGVEASPAWPPATMTLPAGMGGRGLARRGTASAGSSPPR